LVREACHGGDGGILKDLLKDRGRRHATIRTRARHTRKPRGMRSTFAQSRRTKSPGCLRIGSLSGDRCCDLTNRTISSMQLASPNKEHRASTEPRAYDDHQHERRFRLSTRSRTKLEAQTRRQCHCAYLAFPWPVRPGISSASWVRNNIFRSARTTRSFIIVSSSLSFHWSFTFVWILRVVRTVC
jgi:hypothetical protein